MANRAEAYDFSLFESHYDNTVPAVEPRRKPQPKKAPNIVELPKKELEKNAKPKRHPFRAAMMVLSFAAFMVLAVAMVYSQEQLAMLTEKINAATQDLAESRSLEVQLNMMASQKMNDSEVEKYVTGELGMSKITSRQISYVNVAQQDKGKVMQEIDGGSVLDKLLSAIRSWFA